MQSFNYLLILSLMVVLTACDDFSKGPCEGRGVTCTGEPLCDGFKSYYFAGLDESGCFNGSYNKFDVNNIPGAQVVARACATESLGQNIINYNEIEQYFAFAAYDKTSGACIGSRHEININFEQAKACFEKIYSAANNRIEDIRDELGGDGFEAARANSFCQEQAPK